MAVWPFRRRKTQQSNVPAEIQEYYDAERRQHMGVAWLIAFFSLVITALVVAGLFFGGRWAYRKINHKPTDTAKTAQTDTKNQDKTEEKKADAEKSESNSSSTNQPQQTSSNNSGSSQTTNATDQTNSNLANTGPGDTIAIFLVATMVGTMFYQLSARRQLHK